MGSAIPTARFSTLPGKPATFPQLVAGNTLAASDANTLSINAASLAVFNAGGGTVWIPDGLWRYKPSGGGTYLRAYSGVTIRGQSRASILEVYQGSGDYYACFSDAGVTLTDWVLRSLTIRQNPQGNTSADIKTVSQGAPNNNACQFGVAITGANCRRIRFIDTNWEDCCGVNTLWVNSTGGSGIRFRDNDLRFKRGHTTGTMPGGGPFNGATGYDASMIYAAARDVKGSGNVLRVDDYADFNGGVELHGVEQDWQQNQFHGVYTAFSIVPPFTAAENQLGGPGAGAVPFSNVNVSNNQINRAAVGIAMQVPGLSPNQVNAGGWTLHKNKITIWQGTGHHDSTESAGIWLQDNGLTASTLNGLVLTENEIEHEPDTRASSTRYGLALRTTQHGIIVSMRAALTDATLHKNKVKRAPATGIQVGYVDANAPLTNVHGWENETTDCGANPNNAAVNANNQRAHWDITGGVLTNCRFHDNELTDNGGSSNIGLYGMRLGPMASPLFSYASKNRQNTGLQPLLLFVHDFGYNLLDLNYADTLANGAAIQHQQRPDVRVAPTANRTGMLLGAGTYHDQEVTIFNASAFTITFAAQGTYGNAGASNVYGGTSTVIPANCARVFKWHYQELAWFMQG